MIIGPRRARVSISLAGLTNTSGGSETYSRKDLDGLTEFAGSLASIQSLLDAPGSLDLEDLERRLTILDEKLQAALTQYAAEDQMLRIRREVDSQLTQYRRKMKAEQIALVERQYIQKRLLEEFGLPRLSLYYFS